MNKQELYTLLCDPQSIQPQHISALEALTEAYPYSASFVFLYLYGLAKTEDVRYSAELKRLVAYLPRRERLYEMLAHINEKNSAPAQLEQSTNGFDLIDSFLQEARSAGEDLPIDLLFDRPEASDYFGDVESSADDPQVALEMLTTSQEASNEESEATQEVASRDSELFTETLARIYIQQGKYERALSILTSLYLHYPQKNRYFAEQIRYLKRLVNSNQEQE